MWEALGLTIQRIYSSQLALHELQVELRVTPCQVLGEMCAGISDTPVLCTDLIHKCLLHPHMYHIVY